MRMILDAGQPSLSKDQVEMQVFDVITMASQTAKLILIYPFTVPEKGLQGNHFGWNSEVWPPAHDQRGKHSIIDPLTAPTDLACGRRIRAPLVRLAQKGPNFKKPRSLVLHLDAEMILMGKSYKKIDLTSLSTFTIGPGGWNSALSKTHGCKEITVDEPSCSCYAYKEDRSAL